MSPRRANSLTARDSVIRTLAPSLVRAYGVTFEQAKEVLASLTEDERYILFRLKAKCTGKRSASEGSLGGTVDSGHRVIRGHSIRLSVRG